MAKTPPKQENVIIPSLDDESPETTIEAPETQKRVRKPGSTPAGKKHCVGCNELIWVKANPCPLCGVANPPKAKGDKPVKARESAPAENPQVALLKVLKGRGFEVSGTRDIFDPTAEITYTTEKAIEPVLKFVPNYKANGKFDLSLDELLTILKLPLNK